MRNRWVALRNLYGWAAEEEEIERSPLEKVVVAKANTPAPDVISDDDLKLLLKACAGSDFRERGQRRGQAGMRSVEAERNVASAGEPVDVKGDGSGLRAQRGDRRHQVTADRPDCPLLGGIGGTGLGFRRSQGGPVEVLDSEADRQVQDAALKLSGSRHRRGRGRGRDEQPQGDHGGEGGNEDLLLVAGNLRMGAHLQWCVFDRAWEGAGVTAGRL
jgi:hypothetical protein